MDIIHFWQLIGETKRQSEGNCDLQTELLQFELKQLSVEEIVMFWDFFLMFEDLCDRADFRIAYYLLSGSDSDDGFTDFRAWVISRGVEVYSRALKNVETLADIHLMPGEMVECEQFGYAALYAYEEKTGEEMPERLRFSSEVNWDEEYLQQKFPRLWAKFIEE